MKLKSRRLIAVIAAFAGVVVWLVANPASYEKVFTPVENTGASADGMDYSAEATSEYDENAPLVTEVLEKLEV